MVKLNNYGVALSLLIHGIIMVIPFSMLATRHFKDVEIFVIDERPVQPVQEKIIKQKPKDAPKQVIKESLPQPVLDKPEVKEASTPEVVEPVAVSDIKDTTIAKPVAPAVKTSPQIAKEEVRPLLDVEFGSVNAPRFLHREMPVYPLMARRLGKEGRVLLRLTIDENGRLLNIEVIEGAGYGFTEAAVEAVKKSTFLPAMSEGNPVMSKAILPIRFSLRRD
ncbi:TonB domain protein [Dissulfurispira thermophila]|uniref:TonB domain protein n=1 Tax=Dissulfurispira thermophila TaxID=2715679 RepID=A0A7G1GZM1_9BACT|nr:energy transducer TonB [Dissulfurispira thermophila]BCB95940.1 TonB domain protein [Dissulfurispira thermophila]